jgi:hypothetical protein
MRFLREDRKARRGRWRGRKHRRPSAGSFARSEAVMAPGRRPSLRPDSLGFADRSNRRRGVDIGFRRSHKPQASCVTIHRRQRMERRRRMTLRLWILLACPLRSQRRTLAGKPGSCCALIEPLPPCNSGHDKRSEQRVSAHPGLPQQPLHESEQPFFLRSRPRIPQRLCGYPRCSASAAGRNAVAMGLASRFVRIARLSIGDMNRFRRSECGCDALSICEGDGLSVADSSALLNSFCNNVNRSHDGSHCA